jgi:hypothetical protein
VLAVLHELHLQLPLGEVALGDRVVEIRGRVVEVLGLDGLGLLLGEVALTRLGDEVVLHQHRLPLLVDPLVRVDARAAHLSVVRRDAPRAEQPRDHVHGGGREADEVKDAARILPVRHRVRLEGVHHVRELHGVPDEEDLEVVAHQIPVPILRVELEREAARITQRLRRVAAVDDGGEAREERGALAALLEELRARVLAHGLLAHAAVGLEVAVGPGAASMHDTLGDPLTVKVADLLEEVVVLEDRRSAIAHRAVVLVVQDRVPLARGEGGALLLRLLVFWLAHIAPRRRWIQASLLKMRSRG